MCELYREYKEKKDIKNNKKELREKIQMLYKLAKEQFGLNIPIDEQKDVHGFILDLKKYLIEAKINNRYYRIKDRDILIEDVRIQLRVSEVNNRGVLAIHNTSPMQITAFIALMSSLGIIISKYNDVVMILFLAIYQFVGFIILHQIYIKLLKRNTNYNCYNELCLQIIDNIEKGVYDEPKEIAKKGNVIKRLLKKLNR